MICDFACNVGCITTCPQLTFCTSVYPRVKTWEELKGFPRISIFWLNVLQMGLLRSRSKSGRSNGHFTYSSACIPKYQAGDLSVRNMFSADESGNTKAHSLLYWVGHEMDTVRFPAGTRDCLPQSTLTGSGYYQVYFSMSSGYPFNEIRWPVCKTDHWTPTEGRGYEWSHIATPIYALIS